ncbi:MAG TPA: hypothetical protein VFU29_15540 [Chitinophagaceae bacterium]|nr:hypothetical protein [Chitinophagaceae bacterium]
MATRIYFVKKGQGSVTLEIKPTTIGIASSVAKLKKSGGTVVDVGDSGNDATGAIQKVVVGKSADLLSSALVVTTIIDLTAVPKGQWKQVFEQLRINYHLEGGADGPQDFNIDNDDKTTIMDGKIILAIKAIKFEINI